MGKCKKCGLYPIETGKDLCEHCDNIQKAIVAASNAVITMATAKKPTFSCSYCGQAYYKMHQRCSTCGHVGTISRDDCDDCDKDCSHGHSSGCKCKPKYVCDNCGMVWPDGQKKCPGLNCGNTKRVEKPCSCEKDEHKDNGSCNKKGGCGGCVH